VLRPGFSCAPSRARPNLAGVSPRLLAPVPTALIGSLIALLAVLAGTPAQASAPAVRVMTFNVCGNVCRHGEVTRTAGDIAYQIRARRVTVTMLQELCYSQFLGVRARLAGHGYTAVFAGASKGGRCDDVDHRHGQAFGVAIVARGRLIGRVVRRLPSPSTVRSEGRVLLGSVLRIGGRPVYLATTHTAPGGPNLAMQMAAIERYLTPIAATRPVIFGGDLNSLPDNADLDTFYSARYGGTGVFREADDTRTDPIPTFITVPRKIDYLFAGERFFTPRGAATAATGLSDHRMYLGVFAWSAGRASTTTGAARCGAAVIDAAAIPKQNP
jgi:endonuclease/exonuclease/phosphatase family metal-dependent hydrolase